MTNSLGRVLVFHALMGVIVVAAACNKNKSNEQTIQGAANAGGVELPGIPGAPGMGQSPVGEAMAKIGKGDSLTKKIGRELDAQPTPWSDIQPQAKEYAQLAASLIKYAPPKGGKQSWMKLTSSFSQSASELDHAAEMKDLQAAKAAHGALATSCKACHDAHRGGPGMRMKPRGGPGGPPRPPQ